MVKACNFFMAGHWNEPVHCTVALFNCKPPFTDEQVFLVAVQVVHDYATNIPGGRSTCHGERSGKRKITATNSDRIQESAVL